MQISGIIAHAIIKVVVDFTFLIMFIRYAVWCDWPRKLELPNPTMKQTIGLALLLCFAS